MCVKGVPKEPQINSVCVLGEKKKLRASVCKERMLMSAVTPRETNTPTLSSFFCSDFFFLLLLDSVLFIYTQTYKPGIYKDFFSPGKFCHLSVASAV